MSSERLLPPLLALTVAAVACSGNIGVSGGGAGGTAPGAGGAGGTAAQICTPGEQWVCSCYGLPNGSQICNEQGTGFSDCPPCYPPTGGAGGTTSSSSSSSGDCANHCVNAMLDCGETDVDCGGDCPECPTHYYLESECIKSARNGSEICDDAAWTVEPPGTDLVIVCLTDAGGIIYVATNTGPPDPVDGIQRCQGWELNGENAWDNLNYLYQLQCDQEQDLLAIDLSAYVGQTLYFGAHNNPGGGGQFTHICLAHKM